MKVGINGMGRIGRLALRAAFGAAERQSDDPRAGNRLEVVHLNELKGGAAATAHLLAFDTVQGKWRADIEAEGDDCIRIGERKLSFSSHASPADIPWGELGVEVVLECTGKFLTPETIQGHLDRGARRVIVAMEHTARGEPKILKQCSLPLTGKAVVNLIITDHAVIEVTPDGLVLRELAAGTSVEDVQRMTEPPLVVSPDLRELVG